MMLQLKHTEGNPHLSSDVTYDNLLCLTSAASIALQQNLPTTIYSLPAAAYLTATVARQAFVAHIPEVQNNGILKYLVSPWTLLAAYALRGWNGSEWPEKIITGISALVVVHHAGRGLRNQGLAAARGNPMALAACITHIANTFLGLAGASASWNSHAFITSFWILLWWLRKVCREIRNRARLLLQISRLNQKTI